MSTQAHPERNRLLLVEDDDGVRRAIHLMLHGRGYAVRSHCAVEPALADPQAMESDLMVADYRLPDGDGIALLGALRAAGWRGRAVMMTGYPTPGLADAAQAAGYDLLLEKPLGENHLSLAIHQLSG